MPQHNPFADLIPAQPGVNPFADLIPDPSTEDAAPLRRRPRAVRPSLGRTLGAEDVPAPRSRRTRTRGLLVRPAEPPNPAAGPSLAGSVARAVPRGALDMGALALEPLALSRRRAGSIVAGFIERARRARDGSNEEFAGLLREITRSEIPRSLTADLIGNARDVRDGIRRDDVFFLFQALRCQLEGPGTDPCERTTERH